MIIKPNCLSKCLSSSFSKHIKESQQFYHRYGMIKCSHLKLICPYMKNIKFISTSSKYMNSEEAGSKPPTNPTVDLLKNAISKAVKKKVRVDLSVASMERNFITPARAISDFLLKPQDLESLKATKRRSPYENEPPITVYWRKDVEAKF